MRRGLHVLMTVLVPMKKICGPREGRISLRSASTIRPPSSMFRHTTTWSVPVGETLGRLTSPSNASMSSASRYARFRARLRTHSLVQTTTVLSTTSTAVTQMLASERPFGGMAPGSIDMLSGGPFRKLGGGRVGGVGRAVVTPGWLNTSVHRASAISRGRSIWGKGDINHVGLGLKNVKKRTKAS